MNRPFLVSLLLIVIFCSCKKDDPDATDKIKEIKDNITSPTVWKKDNVYVIKKWDFYIENQLTIEAGTVIKLLDGHSITLLNTSGAQGSIIANGTSSNPIIFTSIKDDERGGTTDIKENNGDPSPRAWGPIDLNGTAGSVFNYCEFHYGGFGPGSKGSLILSSGAEATVQYCTFANGGGGKDGNYFYGALNASSASANTVIKNNIFYNNQLPLSIFAEISIDNSNLFSHGFSSNTFNGIFVTGHIGNNTTWLATEVAYAITNITTFIQEGATLTLGNNVVIKFTDSQSVLELKEGLNSIINHDGQGVYFTSFKDDSKKGDTNGDGGLTSPANADWMGIYDWSTEDYANWPNILYNNPNPPAK